MNDDCSEQVQDPEKALSNIRALQTLSNTPWITTQGLDPHCHPRHVRGLLDSKNHQERYKALPLQACYLRRARAGMEGAGVDIEGERIQSGW
jgi:hypothetical protein